MDQVHVIRHKVLVEGLAVRRVAREMGVSRNTVRKYLSQSEPVRKAGRRRPRPVFEKVAPRLAELIQAWRERTTAKQRITASRLHRELRREGFDVGLTVVQDYLREQRRRATETFVPLIYGPGECAQVDFFEVTVELTGCRQKAWMFVMRLMYSGRDFAWLYRWADQVSFLDGHVRAFEHFGAVPHRIIYDNLKAAVRRLVLAKRELTDRFQALVSHYLFEPSFARPYTGHDKGGVEARGKGIRLAHLVPIPRGEELEEISRAMLAEIDARTQEPNRSRQGKTSAELFANEKPKMLPLLGSHFQAARTVSVTVSSSALVHVCGAKYSVPSHWKGLSVLAQVGPAEVCIQSREQTVTHERLGFGGKVVCYRHYLAELARKPQAVRQVASRLIGELGAPFDEFWRLLVDTHGPRQAARVFAQVLAAVCEHGESSVARGLRGLMDLGRSDLVALGRALHTPAAPTVTVPASLAHHRIEQARAADFDYLLSGSDR